MKRRSETAGGSGEASSATAVARRRELADSDSFGWRIDRGEEGNCRPPRISPAAKMTANQRGPFCLGEIWFICC
ncbi:unnamed protein product [Linum tenue]|uniref:Uncharacterized protein n=1 Tax=Linum tenue TaxID=586396 RepID=A0AAV0I8B4_9ROSI|nr:unnamed protein product [Linum tenue]